MLEQSWGRGRMDQATRQAGSRRTMTLEKFLGGFHHHDEDDDDDDDEDNE